MCPMNNSLPLISWKESISLLVGECFCASTPSLLDQMYNCTKNPCVFTPLKSPWDPTRFLCIRWLLMFSNYPTLKVVDLNNNRTLLLASYLINLAKDPFLYIRRCNFVYLRAISRLGSCCLDLENIEIVGNRFN
jgi:hypothetical protein